MSKFQNEIWWNEKDRQFWKSNLHVSPCVTCMQMILLPKGINITCLFVLPPWASPFFSFFFFFFFFFFTIYSHQPKKEKNDSLHRTYTLLIQYLHTDQILLSRSSDVSQKWSLKFFFLLFWLLNLASVYITIKRQILVEYFFLFVF